MKLEKPKCPQCGAMADGTLDRIPGKCILNIDPETGEVEFSGDTQIFWDEQEEVRDADGRVTLLCYQGHNWQSKMEE